MKDENENTANEVKETHCTEYCPIGIDECVECGACDICADAAVIDEEELPSHWQRFIEKSKRPT